MGVVHDATAALEKSLAEQLSMLRGEPVASLPAPLLDVVVRRVGLHAGDVFAVLPRDWEALRHEEGGAGRPLPYWARLWPSGLALAADVDRRPPPAGASVLELGCGLAIPSISAARAGARVLATDGHSDAVVFAAHAMALNEVVADVAVADWRGQGEALAARGPFDVVLAADVLYTRANVEAALRLLPRLVPPGGVIRLADPRRAGARDFLAAARSSFSVTTEETDGIGLHTLRRRSQSGSRPRPSHHSRP
jgi:predicted nicotinamide N-methyase